MQTKIEGILIRKIPYQDRHIIGTLLLRSGRKVSVLFYGGQGGGKKLKSSTLELGHMLRVELGRSKSTSDLYRAKEWSPIWIHEKIRFDYKAFCTMCLMLEIIDHMSTDDDLHDDLTSSEDSMIGLFRVLSNGLVHLEARVSAKSFDRYSELIIYLGKLLIEQGVFPERSSCVFCDQELKNASLIYLVTDHGGFGCSECVGHLEDALLSSAQEGRELWEILGVVANEKYQNLVELKLEHTEITKTLLAYFFYQFHMEPKQLKGLSSVI
ncbi:MAG: hypothetical protein CME60_14595 [Halobacteriovoraceae bacterium]|nr:hypothetical protein [Halobacteriovoraceae bacterium]|tara:strand:- start:177 stop:980 length:804 start_codon:yes stop_codon:yes gene_type:complete